MRDRAQLRLAERGVRFRRAARFIETVYTESDRRVLAELQRLQSRHPYSRELDELIATYLYLMSASAAATAASMSHRAVKHR